MLFNIKSACYEHIDEDLDSLRVVEFLDHCSNC
jgi:hypothetical protein